MSLDVILRRAGELAVFQTHGRPVSVEVDDDAADEFQRLGAGGRRRADEDDRFVRPNQAQPVVNLGNRAFGIGEPRQFPALPVASRLQRVDVGAHRREFAGHRNVLIDGPSELDANQENNEDAH